MRDLFSPCSIKKRIDFTISWKTVYNVVWMKVELPQISRLCNYPIQRLRNFNISSAQEIQWFCEQIPLIISQIIRELKAKVSWKLERLQHGNRPSLVNNRAWIIYLAMLYTTKRKEITAFVTYGLLSVLVYYGMKFIFDSLDPTKKKPGQLTEKEVSWLTLANVSETMLLLFPVIYNNGSSFWTIQDTSLNFVFFICCRLSSYW